MINKRPPEAFTGDLFWEFHKISKADWADLFVDLYRESNGETAPASEILEDAKRRLAILQRYRKKT